jgi:hypothetical protein
MSLEDMHVLVSYQRIADLHADAERYRQVRLSRRRRQRRSRGRPGWLWPSGVAARANAIVGGIFNPPWLSRRDQAGRPGWSARA